MVKRWGRDNKQTWHTISSRCICNSSAQKCFDGHRETWIWQEAGEQKERRGRMEGKDREAHSELWSGYWKRETYTHLYKVCKGVQIIWNTSRKHTAVMLCALWFQGVRSIIKQALPYIIYLIFKYNLFYARQFKCWTVPDFVLCILPGSLWPLW